MYVSHGTKRSTVSQFTKDGVNTEARYSGVYDGQQHTVDTLTPYIQSTYRTYMLEWIRYRWRMCVFIRSPYTIYCFCVQFLAFFFCWFCFWSFVFQVAMYFIANSAIFTMQVLEKIANSSQWWFWVDFIWIERQNSKLLTLEHSFAVTAHLVILYVQSNRWQLYKTTTLKIKKLAVSIE